jgi:hypothetical protein
MRRCRHLREFCILNSSFSIPPAAPAPAGRLRLRSRLRLRCDDCDWADPLAAGTLTCSRLPADGRAANRSRRRRETGDEPGSNRRCSHFCEHRPRVVPATAWPTVLAQQAGALRTLSTRRSSARESSASAEERRPRPAPVVAQPGEEKVAVAAPDTLPPSKRAAAATRHCLASETANRRIRVSGTPRAVSRPRCAPDSPGATSRRPALRPRTAALPCA